MRVLLPCVSPPGGRESEPCTLVWVRPFVRVGEPIWQVKLSIELRSSFVNHVRNQRAIQQGGMLVTVRQCYASLGRLCLVLLRLPTADFGSLLGWASLARARLGGGSVRAPGAWIDARFASKS